MSGGTGPDAGIIPRVNAEVFARIDKYKAADAAEGLKRSFTVTSSYLEIYNEKLHDLLAGKSKGKSLEVKANGTKGVFVEGLSEPVVSTAAEVKKWMDMGNSVRKVASTNMNDQSSRSHSVFCIKIKVETEKELGGKIQKSVLFSKLNLVDLAGSERQSKTGASGETLKEASNINQSLSTLGNVINALGKTASSLRPLFLLFLRLLSAL